MCMCFHFSRWRGSLHLSHSPLSVCPCLSRPLSLSVCLCLCLSLPLSPPLSLPVHCLRFTGAEPAPRGRHHDHLLRGHSLDRGPHWRTIFQCLLLCFGVLCCAVLCCVPLFPCCCFLGLCSPLNPCGFAFVFVQEVLSSVLITDISFVTTSGAKREIFAFISKDTRLKRVTCHVFECRRVSE